VPVSELVILLVVPLLPLLVLVLVLVLVPPPVPLNGRGDEGRGVLVPVLALYTCGSLAGWSISVAALVVYESIINWTSTNTSIGTSIRTTVNAANSENP
jgi:hypothetical protein